MDTEEPVVIIGAKRTPHGRHGGALAHISAPRLAGLALKELLDKDLRGIRAHLDGVFMGEVLTAGVGQNPARQAAFHADVPHTCPATTINKVCSSSLAALKHAFLAIRADEASCVVAGGMENMSMAPHLLSPEGKSLSNKRLMELLEKGQCVPQMEVINSMLCDGLCDAYSRDSDGKMIHMGEFADRCAEAHAITRAEQDEYAYRSYHRAFASCDIPLLQGQMVPIVGGNGNMVTTDECLRPPSRSKIETAQPCFREGGTVTAATSAQIADGASVLVLASYEKAKELGRNPLARVVGFASSSLRPEKYPLAPVEAIWKLTRKTGVPLDSIDFFEINEAFAMVPVYAMRSFRLSIDKVNVLGGALSLGHPIGATGARLVINLTYLLREYRRRYGIAVTCNGGGEAVAVMVENITECF